MKRNGTKWLIAGLAILASTLFLTTSSVSTARAADADLRAGYYFDAGGFALGGGLLTGLGHSGSWWFNPNLEVAFADNVNVFTINGDVHYDLPVESSMSWWVGAGPALMIADPDGGSADSNFGLNVLGGMGAARGGVRPFAQFKAILSDNSETALMGGIRF